MLTNPHALMSALGLAIVFATMADALAQDKVPQAGPPATGIVLDAASPPPGAPTLFASTVQVLGPLPPPGMISAEGKLRVLPPEPPPGAPALTGANAPRVLLPGPPVGAPALQSGTLRVLTPSSPPKGG